MRLISWNVNGLRACMQKGFADYFAALNADFFCLLQNKSTQIGIIFGAIYVFFRGCPAN